MSFHLRYGEPDWNEPPRQGWHDHDIRQHPLSDKSYEELRYEATQKQWATKFVDLNTMALSSSTPNATFVNLKNLTDTVEVIVSEGDDQARWVLHSSLLTNDSEFAEMALSRDFKEKSERIIRFPEEDPGVFGQYVTFLYAKMVFVFALETLVQMYTLGDRLQSIKFANACYESIAKTTDPYSASQIKYIFDNTYTDDRLRKLCISQVSKGILDGRYSFSITHEQEILKDFMPELMVGVTAEVQKRRSGGEKWYPRPPSLETGSGFPSGRPSASPPYSPTTPASSLCGPAPAKPASGGFFTTGASGSGAGIFGGPSPAANGGGLFGTGRSQHSSTTTGGGLFGAQRSNSTFAGGLFGGANNSGGTATSNNPHAAAPSSTTAASTGGGLFNNAQPTSALFGGSRAGSLFSIQQNPPQSTSSLFGNTTRNQHQPPPGGLFGGPTQSLQGSANDGNYTGNMQGTRPQGIVNIFGQSGANVAQSGLATNTTSQAPAHTGGTTQSSSIAPSLFRNTSTASPFAAAPAPQGPPVFSFPTTSQTQPQQRQQNPTRSFSFASSAASAPAAPQSAPKMWTVRNDSHTPQDVNSRNSQRDEISDSPNENIKRYGEDSAHASSLAALEKAAAINNPTRGFVPYTASNFAPRRATSEEEYQKYLHYFDPPCVILPPINSTSSKSQNIASPAHSSMLDNQPEMESTTKATTQPSSLLSPSSGLKFGTSPFHQIMNGKAFAEGPSPSGQRVNRWRPAEDGTPSRLVSSQHASDVHEDGNEEKKGKGKGKEPALVDAALSRDLMRMAFPSDHSLTLADDEYLKNSQGGKITKDDMLSPAFAGYLKSATQEKARENGSGLQEQGGIDEEERDAVEAPPVHVNKASACEERASDILTPRTSPSGSEVEDAAHLKVEESEPTDRSGVDASMAIIMAGCAENARREAEHAKTKATVPEIQYQEDGEGYAAYEADLKEAERKAEEEGEAATRKQERAAGGATHSDSDSAATTSATTNSTSAAKSTGGWSETDLETAKQKLRGFGARIL